MLILTRKAGQEVIIGPDIVIKLIEIKGKQARLGFDVPRSLTIHRREVQDRILAERRRQAQERAS